MNNKNKCIICETKLPDNSLKSKDKRNRITCCKKHARIYDRVYHYADNKLNFKPREKTKELINELKNIIRNSGRTSHVNKTEIENLIYNFEN